MEGQEAIGFRFPAITFSFACISLFAYCWPQLSDLLIYDRQAILRGEIWRLLTAPFVHFSSSHLFWNLFVLCAAGWTIEAAGYPCYWLVCSIAAVSPGPVFLFASPDLSRYGGLSGLAVGAVAYLCLCETRRNKQNVILWLAVLALIGFKIVIEAVISAPIFVSADNIKFRVLPPVHALGYASAFAVFIWTGKRPFARIREQYGI